MESTSSGEVDQHAPHSTEEMSAGLPIAFDPAVLLQPAFLTNDEWFSPASQMWMEWSATTVASALEFVLDRPVSVRMDTADNEWPDNAVFAIAVEHPSLAGGSALLAFDLPAARIVIDTIEADFASVRGAGTLTDVEAGILEYAALAVIDRALRDAPLCAQETKLREFHDARALKAAWDILPDPAGMRTLGFILRVSGREGFIRLHSRGFRKEGLSAPPSAGAPLQNIDPAALIHLHVALPAVKLSRENVESLAVGDLLLPGATQLMSFASPCQVVTSQGWALAHAVFVRDSPTVITVRCGPLALGTIAVARRDDAEVTIFPLLGALTFPISKLSQWTADALLDLPKDLAAPVELVIGLETIGRGELVQFEGELGIRIVSIAEPRAAALAARR